MGNENQIDRRAFLKRSAAFTCLTGAGLLCTAAENASAPAEESNLIGPRAGYSPQIGTLVSMLNWMRSVVLASVRGLTMAQLDYLHDAKANSIGALLLHLAAIERYYQIHTFEGRKWNDWDEKDKHRWGVPSGLGKEARKTIKGNNLAYYLNLLTEGRARTLEELRKRDDTWLMKVDPDWDWGPTKNYCKWFHVCEHESNHNGQSNGSRADYPARRPIRPKARAIAYGGARR